MKYTAITIGPIYKTMHQARKSRELWGTSFLFSYIMKRILDHLPDRSKICLPYDLNVLKDLSQLENKRAGLLPDRLIYEGDIREKVKEIEQSIIKELHETGQFPEGYLSNYLRIYAVAFGLPTAMSEDAAENNNIVIVANKLLDAVELTEKYYPNVTKVRWRESIHRLNQQKFYPFAFKDASFVFPSLENIGIADLRQEAAVKSFCDRHDTSDEESESFYTDLKPIVDKISNLTLRNYHKYVAVVQADGDNIGKTIAEIGNDPDQVRKFSSALFQFAQAAARLIASFGAEPVYIGGDDLLFFSPLARQQSKGGFAYLDTLFNLIADLDRLFEKEVVSHPDLKALYETGIMKPTLSFGVSIAYVKFPLNESREIAYSLMNKAKEIKDSKNKICFQVQKHSGQSFGFTIDKKGDSYRKFLSLTAQIPVDNQLISSVMYKLAPLQVLFNELASNAQDASSRSVFSNRLAAFFAQEFKEEVDKDSRLTAYLDKIVEYYYQLVVDFPQDNVLLPERETDQGAGNLFKLYSTLRFVKHLTAEENE